VKRRAALVVAVVLLLGAVLFRPLVGATHEAPAGVRIVLWHSQRGAEQAVLENLLRAFNREHAGAIYVEPLAVPDASFKDKLLRTVPRGGGPDLFIRPHNELGELLRDKVARPLGDGALPYAEDQYLPGLVEGLSKGGQLYGAPLTVKGLIVFYNKRLLAKPPRSLDELEALRPELPSGSFPLAYDATSLFFHSPFFLAAGGRALSGEDERFSLFDEPGATSFRLPADLRARGMLPPEPSYNEMVRLFEDGKAAAIINGPWYTPKGEIGESESWDVAPIFSMNGKRGGSFVTVEAAFVSASTRNAEAAEEVLRFLAGPAGQNARRSELSLPHVRRDAFELGGALSLAEKMERAQRLALEQGVVTPSSVRMGSVWRPAEDVLRVSIAEGDVDGALEKARYTLERVDAGPPKKQSTSILGVLLAAALIGGTLLLVRQVRLDVRAPEAMRAKLLGSWGKSALGFLAPGLLSTAVLVLAPMIAGALMSLFEYQNGRFEFVGLANFREIMFPPLERAFEARSFYFALAVTVLWTVLNVVLHLTLGVATALLLRPAWIRLRSVYRIVLVLPWAIPNYITALMWKGMFNAQVGAINALLAPFGFEGFAWFDSFHTAFFANLVTNTWLGFPFMMVVTLGALSSLPKEVEEAATLDGASRFQRLRYVIFPHIKPALIPSVILGSVWTFNMFNVVYLVSGGEPGSQTDILISEAYRWAFERGQRYGYAAAYSVLIFAFLVIYGRATSRAGEERTT
jgi:arabinogalactan oligomer / maltooligosaccharide transport system permease protein